MLNRMQKGSNTYVVYEFTSDNIIIDEISMIMINNNQNNSIGLAPIRVESINGINKKMLFDITGKVPLREFVSRRINQDSFKNMMLDLISSIENFDEYMIDVRQILLNIDNVYINELDLKVSFICLAIKDMEQSGDLHCFFKDLIENSNVMITMNEKDYFHCVWNVIRNESGFSLNNIKAALTTGFVSVSNDALKKNELVQQPTITNNKEFVPQPEVNLTNTSMQTPSINNTVTVTPTSEQIKPSIKSTVVTTQEEKKKTSLFGKLFGSKKPTTNSESNVTTNTAVRGGLSSLKNGEYKKTIPNDRSITQANGLQSSIPQTNSFQFGSNINGGSNNSTFKSSVQRSAPNNFNNGTTVLNSMPTNISSGTTVLSASSNVNIDNSVNNRTTVFNSMPTNSSNSAKTRSSMDSGASVLISNPSTANSETDCVHMPELSKQNGTAKVNSEGRISLSKYPAAVNDDQTTVLIPNIGETTVLGGYMQSMPHPFLIRYKNNDRIPINGSVFRIGKERSQVEYFIGDNTAISRNHAKIVVKNGEYFIIDTNSTNHTFVNGIMIQSNYEVKIVNGDVIRLANENFDFKLL